MPDLPRGWRMSNANGELVGPPADEEDDRAYHSGEDSDGSFSGALDIRPDSEGWNDVEDDTEDVKIKCLLCEELYPSAQGMVEHCKEKHGLDFVAIQKEHGMCSIVYLCDQLLIQ